MNSAIANNATAIGANQINAVNQFGSTVVIGGNTDKVASFDGTAWANSDGTGAGIGIHNNGSWLGTSYNISKAAVYAGNYVAGNSNGNIGGITAANAVVPYFGYYLGGSGGAQISDLLLGEALTNQIYAYRYEAPNNNMYLILEVGNTLSLAYILDNSGTNYIYQLNAKYAVPQVNGTYSRHILTGNFTVPGSTGPNGVVNGNGQAISLIGYEALTAAFSTSPQYFPLSDTVNAAGVLAQSGIMGGVDVTYNDTLAPTAIQSSFYPNMTNATQTAFVYRASPNTNTRIDGYGKLTNNFGEPLALPFEIRVGMVNGTMSFLSAAVIDGSGVDNLGTILTNVGEFDPAFQPVVIYGANYANLVWKYNGQFVFMRISATPTNVIQRINDRLYKINTISPQNIVDSFSNTLNIGSADYNGRAILNGGAISAIATPMANVLYSRFSNGIDVGNKLPTCTPVNSATITIPGISLPYSAGLQYYGIDTYVNNAYNFTTLSNRQQVVAPLVYNGGGVLVQSPLYTGSAATTLNPVAIGQSYPAINTTTSGQYTYFLYPNFEGYLFGNQLALVYQPFVINGQTYLFNGQNIYSADINAATNVLNSTTFICQATGLTLLAVSPTTAYFLSAFDNSIFTFMGGRNVDKFKRMNSLPVINQGIFNTRDNSLLLDAVGAFIWVRDGVVTMNPKLSGQSGTLRLYNTTGGLIIGNDANSWQYSYVPTGSSTVVPLSLQTAYFGQNSNEKSILPNWIVTVYNALKPSMTINVTVRATDGTTNGFTNGVENKVVNITPNLWDAAGYCRFRIRQKLAKNMMTSLQLTTNSQVLLQELVAEFRDDTSQTYSDMLTI